MICNYVLRNNAVKHFKTYGIIPKKVVILQAKLIHTNAMKKIFFILSVLSMLLSACGKQSAVSNQSSANPANVILLKDFAPQVINNIPMTHVERAKFDIIDMHAHDYASSEGEIIEWCRTMDHVGVLNTAIMHCS